MNPHCFKPRTLIFTITFCLFSFGHPQLSSPTLPSQLMPSVPPLGFLLQWFSFLSGYILLTLPVLHFGPPYMKREQTNYKTELASSDPQRRRRVLFMLWLCYYLAILAGAWTFSLYAKQSQHKQQNTYIIILALEAHQPSSSYSKQLCALRALGKAIPLPWNICSSLFPYLSQSLFFLYQFRYNFLNNQVVHQVQT